MQNSETINISQREMMYFPHTVIKLLIEDKTNILPAVIYFYLLHVDAPLSTAKKRLKFENLTILIHFVEG